ncbi:tRNA modification GTPase GTPBP3, partial [Tricharina praecox]|uniref:tRNA modification GTPase GTPBP3 n=1 Tax=Tricharina praecox TaxID=43433 RepID=UPI00221EA8D0
MPLRLRKPPSIPRTRVRLAAPAAAAGRNPIHRQFSRPAAHPAHQHRHRPKGYILPTAAAAPTSSTPPISSTHSNPHPHQPTIYALSTPPGKSAIAVIRISGPSALTIYRSLTSPTTTSPTAAPTPRHALLRTLHHPQTREVLDPGALCLFFPGPRSHTGEDVLELHVHGGVAIIRAVLAAVPVAAQGAGGVGGAAGGTRYAEPGEFTRRAFYNDRLSLPEIEALGETLDATTEEQRRRAVRGAAGGLADRYERWRRQLVLARGELEALIDFAEDQHFEESNRELVAGVELRVRQLRERLRVHVGNAVRGELLKNGISLSLVGAPNVGKSSLLNTVVGREAVIVSPEAGTTRDVVDLAVDVGGFMVVLGDTAGLRVDDVGVGMVEEEGIKRARARAMSADVVVAVVDIVVNDDHSVGLRVSPELEKLVNEAEEAGKEVVAVVNKTDLHPAAADALPMDVVRQVNDAFPNIRDDRIFGVSCRKRTEHGIQRLLNGLTGIFQHMTSPLSPTAGASAAEMYESIGATERQRVLVEACISFLDDFLEMVEDGEDVDVVVAAEELRGAAECLGRITGRGEMAGDVEEVLGVVFEK